MNVYFIKVTLINDLRHLSFWGLTMTSCQLQLTPIERMYYNFPYGTWGRILELSMQRKQFSTWVA